MIQTAAIRITLRQIPTFTDSCLPTFAELSRLFRKEIQSQIDRSTAPWPFDDRVLVWLLPRFRAEAEHYHNDRGPRMTELYAAEKIRAFDREALACLCRFLERVRPGIVELLRHAPLGSRSRWMSATSKQGRRSRIPYRF
jgi:hypothetical protein